MMCKRLWFAVLFVIATTSPCICQHQVTGVSVQDVIAATQCPSCYKCLSKQTGQDLTQDCLESQSSEVLRCAAQIRYLYSGKVFLGRPCGLICRVCVYGLRVSGLDIERPDRSAWEDWFPNWLARTNDISPIQGGQSSAGTGQSHPHDPSTGQSHPSPIVKRDVDGDSCCETERTTFAYTDSYTDPWYPWDTWYPVWFYDNTASPPYAVQYRDNVTCPWTFPSCSNTLECRVHAEPRIYLMTTFIPDPTYGHLFIVLTHPNDNAQFKATEVPYYCKCVTIQD